MTDAELRQYVKVLRMTAAALLKDLKRLERELDCD